MDRAIILAEGRGLESFEIRASVLRIPEVSLKLKEAQRCLDELGVRHTDLISALLSEDEQFVRKSEVKDLVTSVVQVGLFERYLKSNPAPKYLMGRTEKDAPLRVCLGTQNIKDLVANSTLVQNKTIVSMPQANAPQMIDGEPLLASGARAAKFEAFRTLDDKGDKTVAPVEISVNEIWQVAMNLHEDRGIQQFVIVGPGDMNWESESLRDIRDRIQVLDSVDIDAMLGWFWSGVRKAASGYAQ